MKRGILLILVGPMVAMAVGLASGNDEPVNADKILATAAQRIEDHRMGDITVVVLDAAKPVVGATVEVTQASHEFLFGCNAYGLRDSDDPLQRAYRERFIALFNYATVPFYWGSYEPRPGKPETASRKAMARWCLEHGIRPKGHPLVWHQVVPAWAPQDLSEFVAVLRERVRSIVSDFAGLIDTWDAINESTVSARIDNQLGRAVKQVGATEAAATALSWAREANPRATLILNDFNISPEYERQIQGLVDSGRAPDAIGIQSHMHRGTWPLERVWAVCETYSRFGIPIHFTETTVLSGRLKSGDRPGQRGDWPSTSQGERQQADYIEKLYRVLFSHPNVAAITWWDFSDLGAWQGAPAGLLREDMSPKPAYERLLKMIEQEWWTEASAKTGGDGEMRCRGFYGAYRISATAPDGRTATATVRLFKDDDRRVTLRLPSR